MILGTIRTMLLAAAAALVLAACGGGGGTTAPRPPAAPPPPPPAPPPGGGDFDTEEFRRSTGLDNIRALAAFEAGGSGEGVIVGTVDTGVDLNHVDLRNNISPLSADVASGRDTPTANDTDGHGTFVAGIIAAERNDRGILGVAFNATIIAARADDPGSCEEEDGCSFFDDDIARGILLAVNNGAKVVNISLGGDGFAFSVLNAVRIAAQNDVLVVISAGNDSEVDPSGFAQLANDPIARGHVLIVGASNQFDQIADFSNRAGNLAQFFVVAPGVDIRSTLPDDFLGIGSGTSFAAPHVSGAAALLKQMFPNLSMQQVGEILRMTARDLGAPGIDEVFGNGLIDLEEAIKPIGTTGVARANGTSLVVDDSAIVAGGAFGDAFSRTDALDGIVITDRFDRTYIKNFSETVVEPQRRLALAGLIDRPARIAETRREIAGRTEVAFAAYDDRFAAARSNLSSYDQAMAERPRETAYLATRLDRASEVRVAYGYSPARLLAGPDADPADAFQLSTRIDTPFLAQGEGQGTLVYDRALGAGLRLGFALSRAQEDGIDRHVLAPLREDTRRNTAIAQLSGRIGALAFGVQAGVDEETGSLLGTKGSGGLALGEGARSSFLALDARLALGKDWQAFGRILNGFTDIRGSASLFGEIGRIRSESFAVGLTGSNLLRQGDLFGISVLQPLRVTGGSAALEVPVSRDLESGLFSFETRRLTLSPSGREIDLEIGYGLSLDSATRIEASLIQQFEAGHIDNGGSITSILLRARTRF
ncbi:MAG: hypothetical protein Kow00104_01830 [Rhodothalassiaceae bacterium]